MAYILCIETTTDICSVALAKDADLVHIEETERTFSHSATITLFVESCLNNAGITAQELDAVAISSGPGSYTALRIGASTAKGLCYALDIPLINIDTMAALARGLQGVAKEDYIIPLLDARRKEVYHAVYKGDYTLVSDVAPHIIEEDSFQAYAQEVAVHFLGDGVEKTKELIQSPNFHFHNSLSSAKNMVELAHEKFQEEKFEDIAYYTPFYYKQANINVQKKNILRS